jgi:O-glycosyl hydrolase
MIKKILARAVSSTFSAGFLFIFLFFYKNTEGVAQTITIEADNYQHIFEGGGVSVGLYMGHHWSMTEANRDKAVRLINQDCNMPYLQDYVSTSLYPPLDANYFDKRADYFKAAKAYRPDVKISMTTNRFPKELIDETPIGGKMQAVLRTTDTAIYTKVAHYYLTLFQGFKDRGVDIDILNVVNEPDWDKQYYYGHNGDNKKGVALLFAEAIPKFKALLRDPNINKSKIKTPQIMGPSTISPDGCLQFIRYFKQNYPQAWAQIDIVATHQYTNGVNENALSNIRLEAEGKPYFQSEMHTNRGDNLGTMPIDSAHRGILSLANTMGTAIRQGVSAWFYFQTHYPHAYTPAGLLSVDWQTTNPQPYQHYYAFKQMTSTQPPNAHIVGRILSIFGSAEVFAFRKKNEDTVYVNIANYLPSARTVSLTINNYSIKSYTQIVTDGTLKNEVTAPQQFAEPMKDTPLSIRPYSVNTFKVVLQKSSSTAVKEVDNAVKIVQIDKTIWVNSDKTPLKSISVYNLTGQIVGYFKGLNTEEYSFDMGSWQAGMYFFYIQNDKGSIVKKVVLSNI